MSLSHPYRESTMPQEKQNVRQPLVRTNVIQELFETASSLKSAAILATGMVLVGHAVSAQEPVFVDPVYQVPRRIYWSRYDPYYAVTSRIYAQADLIRAQGDAAVSFAEARNLNAEAYSKELDNWVKEVRAYWERKRVAEVEKLKMDQVRKIKQMKFLNDQKWRNSQQWERLKNQPELNAGGIQSGAAHNFLLARLQASALPYQFDPATSRFESTAIDDLKLDPEWLADITLKQGAYQFPANQTVQANISLWPYLLSWEEFDASRKAYEKAREEVVNQSSDDGKAAVASIMNLQEKLMALSNEFHRSNVRQWVKEHKRYTQWNAADRFLRELDREIVLLEKTRDIRPMRGKGGYDPRVDGEHLISLLCYMNRNGLEFAKAQPGSEPAYHQLFVMMRALYLTVEEQDESTRAQDLSELAR